MMDPKSFGGLGLGSLRAFNITLIIKWKWKLNVDNNAMWANVILAIHKSNRSWKLLPLKAEIGGVGKNMMTIV